MKKQPLILLAVFLFASILIFLNNDFPAVKFLSNVTQTVFSPPKALLYDLRVFISRGDGAELRKIKEEHARLSEKLIEFQRLKGDTSRIGRSPGGHPVHFFFPDAANVLIRFVDGP